MARLLLSGTSHSPLVRSITGLYLGQLRAVRCGVVKHAELIGLALEFNDLYVATVSHGWELESKLLFTMLNHQEKQAEVVLIEPFASTYAGNPAASQQAAFAQVLGKCSASGKKARSVMTFTSFTVQAPKSPRYHIFLSPLHRNFSALLPLLNHSPYTHHVSRRLLPSQHRPMGQQALPHRLPPPPHPQTSCHPTS
jgi:hypothetical protein